MAVKSRLVCLLLALLASYNAPAFAEKSVYDKSMESADAAYAAHRYEDALKDYEIALKELSATPESVKAARVMESIGQSMRYLKRDNEAEEMLKHALKIYEEKEGPNSKDCLYACLYLARLCMAQERYVEALPLYKRVVAIAETRTDLEADFVTHRIFGIASCLEGMGNFDEAETYFNKGVAMSEKLPKDELTVADYENYADYLDHRKKTKQAENIKARIKAIKEQMEKK